jgi:ATP-dependent DNA helicase PIF1
MNAEQKKAFEMVKEGQNVFITGPGGCGKSFTLHHIMEWARKEALEFAVTASTGCAAYLIRGRTLHSYLGIGLATKSAKELAGHVLYKKPHIAKKLRRLKLLVLDEVSMISDSLFEKVSEFLSIIRKNSNPFGGVQLVLSGDFAQLPNVEDDYCFKSTEWSRANITVVELKEMMRQNGDEKFQSILSELRWGKCSKETYTILKSLKNTQFKYGIIPTILFAKNVNVDSINESKYKKLVKNGAEEQTYKSASSASGKAWGSAIKIPDQIELCIGAQVVLSWNMGQDTGLVNGSRGVVIGFTPQGPIVKFVDGQEVIIEKVRITEEEDQHTWVSFMPLRLAFALTIHKAQGMTLDAVVIDLGESIFENGQAYVAISRARSLESIRLVDIKRSSFKTAKDVLEFYANLLK